jgi:hypothetical protein
MRMMQLALVTVLTLSISAGAAFAIEVKKKRDTPGDPEDVWALIGDFCAIKNWHPVVADCVQEQEGDVIYRTLALKNGGKIKEKLTAKDETSYSYEIVESPLPVKNYKATLTVEEDTDSPERSEVEWEASFDANGASDEDAEKTIAGIFEAGIKSIKQMALDAWDAKHPEGSAQDEQDKN